MSYFYKLFLYCLYIFIIIIFIISSEAESEGPTVLHICFSSLSNISK